MKPLLSLNIEDKKSFQTQKAPKLRVPAVFSHHVLQIELEEAESKGLMSCRGQVSLAQNAQMRSCCQSQLQLLLYLCLGLRVAQQIMLSGKSAAVGKAHSWVLVVILFLLCICRRIHLLWGSCFIYIHEIEFPWEESSSFAS